jgi:sialic acid synthase SpsE|tara:strand:+ start:2185 stop:2361 length:177 start_codon:yes stop_codon:yes gene_type:complete
MKINKTIIIAEDSVNHNGNIKNVKKLIDVTTKAKADYVKFQTTNPKLYISKNVNQDKI